MSPVRLEAVYERHSRDPSGDPRSAVRWGVAGNIVWAWVLTIPASAFVASIAYWISLQLY